MKIGDKLDLSSYSGNVHYLDQFLLNKVRNNRVVCISLLTNLDMRICLRMIREITNPHFTIAKKMLKMTYEDRR